MFPLLLVILGFVCGAALVWFLFEPRWRNTQELKKNLTEKEIDLKNKLSVYREENSLFKEQREIFESKKIKYQQLDSENKKLKIDLKNIYTNMNVIKMESDKTNSNKKELSEKCEIVGKLYFNDVKKSILKNLNVDNFTQTKQKLDSAITKCREIGIIITKTDEIELINQLKERYKIVVQQASDREEQIRLREQIREEQKREREAQKAIEIAEREKRLIQEAIDRLNAEKDGKHQQEIEQLKLQLAEAEAKSIRAISQAQITKAGHIYVISNIGSFGKNVYKIGMTRRLDPMERVIELGDASVPFPFDVHMMISCNDAPTLEKKLHHHFRNYQVNKINPRKEFFRIELNDIVKFVTTNHGEVAYKLDADATQFNNSLNISDEDQKFIEDTYEANFDEGEEEDGEIEN